MATDPQRSAEKALAAYRTSGATAGLLAPAEALIREFASENAFTVARTQTTLDGLEAVFPLVEELAFALLDAEEPAVAVRLVKQYDGAWSRGTAGCTTARARHGLQRIKVLDARVLHRRDRCEAATVCASAVRSAMHARYDLCAATFDDTSPYRLDLAALHRFLNDDPADPAAVIYRAATSIELFAARGWMRYHPPGSPLVNPRRHQIIRELVICGEIALRSAPQEPDMARAGWHALGLGVALASTEIVHTPADEAFAIERLDHEELLRPTDWRGQVTRNVPKIKRALMLGEHAFAASLQRELQAELRYGNMERHVRVMSRRGWDEPAGSRRLSG